MEKSSKIFVRFLSMLLVICTVCTVLPQNFRAQNYTSDAEETVLYNEASAVPLGEIVSLREENVKHFRMSDGSVVAATYDVPVHTLEDGEWVDIDNTLSEVSSELQTSNQRIKFAKKINGSKKILTLHDGNKKIEFSMPSAVKNTEGVATNLDSENDGAQTELQKMMTLSKVSSSVRYEDIMSGIDLEYIVVSNTIKENIIVNEKADSYEYEFSLKLSNLEAVAADNGDVLLTDGEDVYYTIPAPFMIDANGVYSEEVSYTLSGSNGSYTLTVTANSAWMNTSDRAYPVKIDPTVVTRDDSTLDASVTAGYISSNTETFAENVNPLLIGLKNEAVHRTYWKLENLPTLPKNSVITSATFGACSYNVSSNGSSTKFNISEVTSGWTSANLNWSTQSTYGTVSSDVLDYIVTPPMGGYFISWNILDTVKRWYEEESSNYGLCIYADDTTVDGMSIHSNITPGSYQRPSLIIKYLSDTGIEENRTYHETSISANASGYIDYTSGHLKVLLTEIFCEDEENSWPVELVYNASQLASGSDLINADMGNYWRFGIDEKIIKDTTDNTKYTFIDSTGAVRYIQYNSTSKVYCDTANPETTMTIMYGEYQLTYNGETHNFNNQGQLKSIVSDDNTLSFVRDTSGQLSNISLNNDTERAIAFSYDTNGYLSAVTSQDTENRQGLCFTYTDSVLSGIEVMNDEGTYESAYAFTYDSNGNLTQITNSKDCTCVEYAYEKNLLKRVQKVTEKKFTDTEYEITGKHIFRYDAGATYVYTPGANGEFDSVSIPEDLVIIENSECDDIVTAYLYDNNYRIIQTYSENITGSEFYSGAIYTYNDDGSVKRITNIQDDRNINFIGQSSYTTLPTVVENTTYTYSIDTSVSKLGISSIKVEGTDSSSGEAVVKFSPSHIPTGNIVFSCYVKMENITGEVFARVSNKFDSAVIGESVHLTGTTAEDVGNGWQRLFFTFDTSLSLYNVIDLVVKDSAGTVYFDGFQLENNRTTPSTVSRLKNGTAWHSLMHGWDRVNANPYYYDGNYTWAVTGNKSSVNTLSQTVTMNTGVDEVYVLSGLTKAASAYAGNASAYGQPEPLYRISTEVTLTDGTNTWTQAPQVTDINKDNRNWQYFSHPVFVDKTDETHDYTNAKVVSVKITLDYSYNANMAWFKEMTFTRTSALDFAYDEDGNVISMSMYYADDYTGEDDETVSSDTVDLEDNSETTYTDETEEHIQSITYKDEDGNVTSVTRYAYNDDYSLVLSEINREGSSETGRILSETLNTYDAEDNLIKVETYTASGTLAQRTVTEYDANGNVLREIDVNGVVKTYQYDSEDRLIYETTGDYRKVGFVYTDDSDKVSYTYDDLNGNGTFDADVDKRISYTYDGDGNLTLIDGNTDYTLTYNLLGYTTAVKVGNIENFVTYTYSGGNLASMSYLNGYTENYEYDNNNNVTKLWKKASSTAESTLSYEWVYNAAGLLYKEFDYELNRTTHYEYDADGVLLRTYTIDADGKNLLQIEYPQKGSVDSSVRYIIDGVILDELDVTADEENNTTTLTSHAGIVTTTTDDLGRVIGSILQTTEDFALMESYSYLNVVMTPGKADTSSSTYVSTLTMADGTVYGYSYDSIGNITRVTENGVLKLSYQYDGQGQLVREDNVYANATYAFTYDGYGNILTKSEYSYTAPDETLSEVATSTNTYSYGNENWPDQLTEYNGEDITYDEIGNPLSYYNGQNFTFTWEGRQLATATDGTNSYAYTYNSNGIRVEKVANSVVHKYTVDRTKILAETYGDTALNFYYDENNSPIAFSVNDMIYYYGKNLQGDVVKIYTASGEVVAEYAYDAWGKLLAITDANGNVITDSASPAVVNPIRYRGYYYDVETGFYYLNSRYYDSSVGRFLNADEMAFLGVSDTVLGYNLYGYCENNPVMYGDPSGYVTPANVIGAVIGAVIGVVGGVFLGNWLADVLKLKGWKRWAFVGSVSVLVGAAAGAIGYFIGPYVAKIAVKLGQYVASLIKKGKIALKKMSTNAQSSLRSLLKNTCCFIADTKVSTPDGDKPIEDIIVGDSVYAMNTETGEVGIKTVTEVFIKETYSLCHIFVNGEEIVCTEEHPFWVNGKGWVAACNLCQGDTLCLQNKETVVIVDVFVEKMDNPVTVYNFEVEGWHTYFVGLDNILVHNKCNLTKIKDSYLKQKGFDAHAIKKDFVPKKDISKFDMYYDKDTGLIYLLKKGANAAEAIATGLFIK